MNGNYVKHLFLLNTCITYNKMMGSEAKESKR